MKPIANESSVVVVGSWNRFIFTQEWVFENLADQKDVRMEFPVTDLSLPYRYSFNEMTLIPGSDRIIITPHVYSETCFKQANDLAVRIARKLPETPYKAFGFNISYMCNSDSSALSELKAVPSGKFKYNLSRLTLERQFHIDDKVILNLTMTEVNEGLFVKFNYHHQLRAKMCANDMVDKFSEYMEDSKQIMNNVYGETIYDSESEPDASE
jgi:hypothetical protein